MKKIFCIIGASILLGFMLFGCKSKVEEKPKEEIIVDNNETKVNPETIIVDNNVTKTEIVSNSTTSENSTVQMK